ncbi:MAG: penicillin-binding transpeptidase domain-containing protein [Eubacteriales bacterium]
MKKKIGNKVKRRMVFTFFFMVVALFALTFRVAWIQVVKGDEYSKKALSYQIRDESIEAKRGEIYDKTGKELAISAAAYSIWVRPEELGKNEKNEYDQEQVDETLKLISSITEQSVEEIEEKIKNGGKLVKIAKYIEKDKARKLQQKNRRGVELEAGIKRYYPLGEFGAHVLGSVTDDNKGMSGIELKYESYLKGVPGRWIKETDAFGKSIAFAKEKYYDKTDGLNLVLTIDEVIQHYVEKEIKATQERTGADQVMCVMMEPKTGEIMAMAKYPDFDPNNSRVPLDPAQAALLEAMNADEKMAYWNRMWRNPLVNDTYEPGSTFKLLTTAMALEERLTNLNEGFVCNSFYTVAGEKFRCPAAHGNETLVDAVKNSCNPVMATLAQRIGLSKFYEYLELFGIRNKTGVDFPGEAAPIMQDKKYAGPVGLATMSYGQGIAVTPLQLLTAVCAIGNEGKLMQPHLVHKLTDAKGETINEIKPKVVRQVISKQTANEVSFIMENAVAKGVGTPAVIPGYRVGGKTGTAQKPKNGKYTDETWSSFVGMAPMDDPKVAILIIVDNPKGMTYGNVVAAPPARTILEETLRYLHIQPNYTQEEQLKLQKGKFKTPNVIGKPFGEAITQIKAANLTYNILPNLKENESLEGAVVTDQYPKPGDLISQGASVSLYRE